MSYFLKQAGIGWKDEEGRKALPPPPPRGGGDRCKGGEAAWPVLVTKDKVFDWLECGAS